MAQSSLKEAETAFRDAAESPARLVLVPPPPESLQGLARGVDRLVEVMVARASLGTPALAFERVRSQDLALSVSSGSMSVAQVFTGLADYVDPYLEGRAGLGWLASAKVTAVLDLAADERWMRGALVYVVSGYLWRCHKSCPTPMDAGDFALGVADVVTMVASRSPWLRWVARRCRELGFEPDGLVTRTDAPPSSVSRWATGKGLPRGAWRRAALARTLVVDVGEMEVRMTQHVRPVLPHGWSGAHFADEAMEVLVFWPGDRTVR